MVELLLDLHREGCIEFKFDDLISTYEFEKNELLFHYESAFRDDYAQEFNAWLTNGSSKNLDSSKSK